MLGLFAFELAFELRQHFYLWRRPSDMDVYLILIVDWKLVTNEQF